MKRNEVARFAIAPHKAYGASGIAGVVPPDTVVFYEIKLIVRQSYPQQHVTQPCLINLGI